MLMISNEISWWDISVVQVIQVIQVIQVMKVRLAHLWPDFRVISSNTVFDSDLMTRTRHLILMFLAAARIAAYPAGAPQKSCSSMIPGHGAQPQTLESSPYKVEVQEFDVHKSISKYIL